MDTETGRGAWIPEHACGEVAVMDPPLPRPKRVGTTRIVLDEELNPFERLDPGERKRLLVRVLCGLVAYDAEDAEDAGTDRLAG